MRLIDADELITAFPCGESVRTESVRATINHMPPIEVSEGVICQGRGDMFNDCQAVASAGQEMYAKGYEDGRKSVEVSEDAISRKGIKIRLGKRFSSDPRRIMEIVKETVDEAPSVIPTAYNLKAVEDCVSKEWLYNELTKLTAVTPTQIDMVSDFTDIIKNAPSVVPSRAEGEWIYIDEPIVGNPYERYRCSACELEEPHKTDYCPNCGAKMCLE